MRADDRLSVAMVRRQGEVDLEGRRIPFELNVSPRARWVRAEVVLHRGLRVFVPEGKGEAEAVEFLRRRRRWLVRALARMERLAERVPVRSLESGSTIPFLGRDLRLELAVGPAGVRVEDPVLHVRVPRRVPGIVRRALRDWMAGEAERRFGAWVGELAGRHRLTVRRVRVSDAERRWGSCSPTGTLSFHWRLMMAPESVARYLVAHELAHLTVKNHSARFWSRVAELDPAYREAERWLRRFGVGLVL
jgi:hypothetical protein